MRGSFFSEMPSCSYSLYSIRTARMQCNDAVEDGVLLALISLRRQFQRITETVIDLLIRIELIHRLEQNLHSRGSKTPTSLAVLAACTKSVFSCAPWMKHSMFMVYGTTVKECKHSPTCWRFGPRNTLVPSYDDRGAEFAPRFGGQQQGAQGFHLLLLLLHGHDTGTHILLRIGCSRRGRGFRRSRGAPSGQPLPCGAPWRLTTATR